jgi:hypothetical protein
MSTAKTAANVVTTVIGEPAKRTNLPSCESLKTSKLAAVAWTAMRVWLGVMWIQAGSAKLWGAEAAAFIHGGAGVAGLFTRVAALGSLALLFTYVMSGTASVCAFYAAFAIVILVMWRTSSWIGVDGLVAGYRQRHPELFSRFTFHLHFPQKRSTAGTVAAHPAA